NPENTGKRSPLAKHRRRWLVIIFLNLNYVKAFYRNSSHYGACRRSSGQHKFLFGPSRFEVFKENRELRRAGSISFLLRRRVWASRQHSHLLSLSRNRQGKTRNRHAEHHRFLGSGGGKRLLGKTVNPIQDWFPNRKETVWRIVHRVRRP